MDNSHDTLPPGQTGLFTDLYELTMAQALFRPEMFSPATFRH